MTWKTTPRLLLLLLPLTLLQAPADAQEHPPVKLFDRNYTWLPEAKWGKLGPSEVGRRFYLEARWKEFFNPGILIYTRDDTRRFLIVPGKPGQPLFDQCVQDEDYRGRKLEKGKSMVRIYGTSEKRKNKVVVSVDRVERLDDQDKQFLARLEALGNDVAEIRALAEEAKREHKRYKDPALAEAITKINLHELRVRQIGLGAEDFAKKMSLARAYRDTVNDQKNAIALYAEIFEGGKAPKKMLDQAKRELTALRAVRTRVVTDETDEAFTWVPFEEFKTAEGFIQRGGVWMRRELAELQDARAVELSRRQSDFSSTRKEAHKCRSEAEEGRVMLGQNYTEVFRALGQPAKVRHLLAPLDGSQDAVWTQWICHDGRRVYFMRPKDKGSKLSDDQGEVILKKDAADPWPTG